MDNVEQQKASPQIQTNNQQLQEFFSSPQHHTHTETRSHRYTVDENQVHNICYEESVRKRVLALHLD